MPTTVQQKLDLANPNDLPSLLQRLRDTTNSLGFGALIAALRPRNTARSGLTSSATQVHDKASMIFAVQDAAGTNLAMISGAAPGAGEVRVEYDATTGVPTFTFAGALTAYIVHESGPLPQTLSTVMATQL